MDYKKIKTDNTAVTRKIENFSDGTNNIYETVAMLAKRSYQISAELKKELDSKIEEYASTNDNLEEVFENKEQIEIARYYEHLPKSTLLAIYEYLNDMVYFRNPLKEEGKIGGF